MLIHISRLVRADTHSFSLYLCFCEFGFVNTWQKKDPKNELQLFRWLTNCFIFILIAVASQVKSF